MTMELSRMYTLQACITNLATEEHPKALNERLISKPAGFGLG